MQLLRSNGSPDYIALRSSEREPDDCANRSAISVTHVGSDFAANQTTNLEPGKQHADLAANPIPDAALPWWP